MALIKPQFEAGRAQVTPWSRSAQGVRAIGEDVAALVGRMAAISIDRQRG